MSTFQVALFLHIAAAVLYFAGLILATAALSTAQRLDKPSAISAVLGLSRVAVILVATGGVAALALGFWLVELQNRDVGEAWLSAAVALLIAAFVLGAIGGQRPKRARTLATRLAAEGDTMTPELRGLLHDRLSAVLNGVAGLASIAILVLMVWQPGG